jgi:hypothetical protein
MLPLVRASSSNGIFPALKEQWRGEIARLYGEDESVEYYQTMMQHAQDIAAEDPQDGKYGIYALRGESADRTPNYVGLIHVNHKLPNTSASTVRMIWNILRPQYDYDQPDDIAEVMASYIIGGIRLCRQDMPAKALQIYLHNGTDRRYAAGAAGMLRGLHPELHIVVRGTWLHIDDIDAIQQAGGQL